MNTIPRADMNSTQGLDYNLSYSAVKTTNVYSSEVIYSNPPDDPIGIYDYIRQAGEGEYDYDSPYWRPADEEKELLAALKKLRITSVAHEELK